jgi:hypothetical protein
MKFAILIHLDTDVDTNVDTNVDSMNFVKAFIPSLMATRDTDTELIVYVGLAHPCPPLEQCIRAFNDACVENKTRTLDVAVKIVQGDKATSLDRMLDNAADDGCELMCKCVDGRFLAAGWINACRIAIDAHDGHAVVATTDSSIVVFSKTHKNTFGKWRPNDVRLWDFDAWITRVYEKANKLVLLPPQTFQTKVTPDVDDGERKQGEEQSLELAVERDARILNII